MSKNNSSEMFLTQVTEVQKWKKNLLISPIAQFFLVQTGTIMERKIVYGGPVQKRLLMVKTHFGVVKKNFLQKCRPQTAIGAPRGDRGPP